LIYSGDLKQEGYLFRHLNL